MNWSFNIASYGLPYPGTWLDQPAGLLSRIQVARNTYECVKAWMAEDDWVKFRTENPARWQVVTYYLEARNHERNS